MQTNTKGGSCWQLSFSPTETYPENFTDFIDEYFTTSSLDYGDDGLERLTAYADINFDEKDFAARAELAGISLPPYKKTLLESANWLKDYVIKFAPVEIADFLIYGIHETQAPQTDKIPLQIYAATAFGSEHPTTRCCLQAISWLKHENVPHRNILDMGTGSGILALACAALWQEKTHITAVDIDEEAVIVTLQNAATNHLEQHIDAAAGDGYNTPLAQHNVPYDLILSNILARPLIEMAPSLYAALKPGGYCVLSGFVDNQEDWVVSTHEQQGLKLVKKYQIEDWRAVIMEKI